MAQFAFRLGLYAAAAATLAAVAWLVLAADPSGSQAPPSPMPKAIATADTPAIVKVARPPGATRSIGGPPPLRITVRPEVAERSEPYVVNVYAVPAAGAAETPAGSGTLVGSFSFFPPPRAGEVRTFSLPAPDAGTASGPDITLRVELVPAAPDSKLAASKLAILDARIGAE